MLDDLTELEGRKRHDVLFKFLEPGTAVEPCRFTYQACPPSWRRDRKGSSAAGRPIVQTITDDPALTLGLGFTKCSEGETMRDVLIAGCPIELLSRGGGRV